MDKLDQWGDSEFHFATYDYDGSIIEEHDKIITQEEKIERINEEFSSFWQISEKLNQKLLYFSSNKNINKKMNSDKALLSYKNDIAIANK